MRTTCVYTNLYPSQLTCHWLAPASDLPVLGRRDSGSIRVLISAGGCIKSTALALHANDNCITKRSSLKQKPSSEIIGFPPFSVAGMPATLKGGNTICVWSLPICIPVSVYNTSSQGEGFSLRERARVSCNAIKDLSRRKQVREKH